MYEDLKLLIRSNLLASGLPELDSTSFVNHRVDLPNGVRAVLVKGAMNLSINGSVDTKEVVLKTINREYAYERSEAGREKLVQYFDREAGIWRHSQTHPNVLELYGFMMIPSNPFPSLVCPYYPEGDLRLFVEKWRGLSAQVRIRLIADIARGLLFLHNLTPVIIHRDIRAKNVLVRRNGATLSAVIIDFGSAKLSDPALFKIMNSTIINFRAWCPPEYLLDMNNYTNPTKSGDIWSLACTCLETFTARDPFPDDYDFDDELEGRRRIHPPEYFKEAGGISDALWSFMGTCWNMNPEKRPSTSAVVCQMENLVREL